MLYLKITTVALTVTFFWLWKVKNMCLHLCTVSQCVAYTFVTNRIEAYAYNKPEVTATTVSRNMEICRRRTSMRFFFFYRPRLLYCLYFFWGTSNYF